MPEQTPASSPSATPTAKPPAAPTIQIAEEFGTAKKNLPPAKVVLIAVAGVIVVVLIASFFKRATPHAEGSLDNITAVEIPTQQSTMAALTFTLRNVSDKDVVIQSLKGRIKSDSGDTDADAVSAVDLERYYQAFPALKAGTQPGLPPESRIHPGQNVSATIIVLFPVTQDVFNRRQRTSVVIQPYDGLVPIVLTR
jgi:hypothetical protein